MKANFIFTVGQLNVGSALMTINGVTSSCSGLIRANDITGKAKCHVGALAIGDVVTVRIGFFVQQDGGPFIGHLKWHDVSGPVGKGLYTMYRV